jgi:hypothetical protein
MPYSFFYDVPGNPQIYEQVKAAVGAERPDGLVVHLVVETDGGLRHIDVWDSQADWECFRAERVQPAVRKVLASMGVPDVPEPTVQELQLVDVWMG